MKNQIMAAMAAVTFGALAGDGVVDGGRSFRLIGEVPRGSIAEHWSMSEPTLFEGKDGTLTALIRYELDEQGQWQKKTNMLRSESRDDGKTFDVAHEVKLFASGDNDLGYATTIEYPDGTFLTAYYAHPGAGKPATLMGTKWKPSAFRP